MTKNKNQNAEHSPNTEREQLEKMRMLNAKLTIENRQHRTKLTILYEFIMLLRRGYDALLHHGVNYQGLKEYTDRQQPLDNLEGKPLEEAEAESVGWIRMMLNAIDAAVRRKNFKVILNEPPTNTRH